MTQQVPPTFKLVLVGDGGTGKASSPNSHDNCNPYSRCYISSTAPDIRVFSGYTLFDAVLSDHQQ
jgi:hypothetical protein